MKIAIIEDEKLTAKDLANTIKAIDPDAEIVAILHSVGESLSYFDQNPKLDLIFSDIELGDGLSFEIFQKINNRVPIIFCTAYQQYTLEAFRTIGIDYVLKPFSKASIEKTLTKYKTLQNSFNSPSNDVSALFNALKNKVYNNKPSVIIHQGDKIIPIKGEDIAVFFIENEVTFAYTFDQKRFLVGQKMDSLEKTFSPGFFRANRQFLINRKAVKDATHYFNRKMLANLNIPFSDQIVVGKLKTMEFLNWLSEG